MKRKFSMKYRLEKWYFEDSKTDMKKLGRFVMEGLTIILVFASLFLIPALFH